MRATAIEGWFSSCITQEIPMAGKGNPNHPRARLLPMHVDRLSGCRFNEIERSTCGLD